MAKMTMMEYIERQLEMKRNGREGKITLAAFTEAMQSRDPDKIEEALEAMAEAGGYENLED